VPQLVNSAAAIAGKSSDNVTALAMMWEGGEEGIDDPNSITTNVLPLGAVTTTIEAPRHADLEGTDIYNDNDIEKAIEEIRKAIEKSSKITGKG
jgi:protein phosphatase